MYHCVHFLSDIDDLYPDDSFISHSQLGSRPEISCDLPRYEPFSKKKVSRPRYYQSYASTYPPTADQLTNKVWPSHSHFGSVLDSPLDPINATLTSQASPGSQPTWDSELLPIDSDAPFIPNDDNQAAYPERKDLLSPLNGFRLQNLPPNNSPSSVMPQCASEWLRETGSCLCSPDILSSPDSPATSPYLSYHGEYEPWMTSPASVTTDTDDDSSLASSVSSLSPEVFDQNTFLGEAPVDDEDGDDICFFPPASPRKESIYHPLEQYPLHTSSDDSPFMDDDLPPLTFSPPGLPLLSPSEPEHQPTSALHITTSSYNPPPHNYYSFDFDPEVPVPCSPSRRRSATLPELEPAILDADPFGLHRSLPVEVPTPLISPALQDMDMDIPNMRWRSLPGCETDDDLIPLELASKNYIPDPSVTVPTTSTGIRSLLLWDHDHDNDPDRSDIPTPRSPSPENFYLDPSVLAECADEEMRKVYELRQRSAKSEKWERERCRELSALLRLKLDERGVLGSGGGGDYGNHQSGSRSLPDSSNLSFSSSSSSSDSLTVHQPQSGMSASSSSLSSPLSSAQNSILIPTSSTPTPTLPLTLRRPQAQSEGPKHKITNMAQLVASMLIHRQSDTLRRHLSRKAGSQPPSSHSSHYYSQPSPPMGGAGMTKVLPTPRSRLSKVILPEELELDLEEEEQELIREVEKNDDESEQDEEDMDMAVDDGPLGGYMDMDLDERGSCGNSSGHNVTGAAPLFAPTSTE